MADHGGRWHEIDELFAQALELDADARIELLDRACAGDPELRSAVEKLLASSAAADDFMEVSASGALENAWRDAFDQHGGDKEESSPSRIGQQLGAFRLTRTIGRGGNASVYLGERVTGDWEQTVAVKVMRRGLDTDDVIARFSAERQILSTLKHPNIAQLIDGGTTDDGLPYLVMEYVSGEPITDYCNSKGLGIHERLEIFSRVLAAIAFAQRHLVVHRDLKPSNILVDQDGRVKLLDFGIAKILGEDSMSIETPHTRTGYRPLTPRYASPEQFAGQAVTTASDVYQLGLLLIELLTGELPQRSDAMNQRQAAHTVPLQPSALIQGARGTELARTLGTTVAGLRRRLRGDLDTIALVATRTEPERRYESAAAMRADIESFLASQPISARRRSSLYRAGRFVKRHPTFLPAMTIVLGALAVYGWTLNRHAAEVEAERNIAQSEAERANIVRALLVDMFESPDPYRVAADDAGRDITVREALLNGIDRLGSDIEQRPEIAAELQGTLAGVFDSLDYVEDAYRLRELAFATERELYGDTSPDALQSMLHLGELAQRLGRMDEAEQLLEGHLSLASTTYGDADTRIADSLVSLAQLRRTIGPTEEAETHFERAVLIYRSADPLPELRLAGALSGLAQTISTRGGDTERAVEYQSESLELRRVAAGEDHLLVAETQEVLAQILSNAREYERALPLFEQSLTVKVARLGEDHNSTLTTRNNLALTLSGVGRHIDAVAQLRIVHEARIRTSGYWHQETAAAKQNLAATLVRLDQYAEASEYLGEAYEIYRQINTPNHHLTAFPLLTRSFVQLQLGDAEGAEASASEASAILQVALPTGHFATTMGECRWGQALAMQQRLEESEVLLVRSVSAADNPQMPGAYRDECREALAQLYERTGRAELAEGLRTE